MAEPTNPGKTLSTFVLQRLGGALRERSTVYPTLPSRLYGLVKKLDRSQPPSERREDGPRNARDVR
jgi:hypothetical protein